MEVEAARSGPDREATASSPGSGAEAESRRAACCVVGAGAAGCVLAFVLARQGVPVVLLERGQDLERQFRGDTLHPSVLAVLDELGVAERLLRRAHSRVERFSFQAPRGSITIADFGRLRTPYPFVALIPQARFLEFMIEEAARYPDFRFVAGAAVDELVKERGRVVGARYSKEGRSHEVRADLVVGADGRSSTVRRLAALPMRTSSPPMDVLWFRLPRRHDDSLSPAAVRGASGHLMAVLDRSSYWQIGYVIPKGEFPSMQRRGVDELRRAVSRLEPSFAGRVETLSWDDVTVLSVESSRARRWWRPGVLLIGDAAHVMTPVGGVGINTAIQDAVVAANVLAGPLRRRTLRPRHVAAVQLRREVPVRLTQAFQRAIQQVVLRPHLSGTSGGDRPPAVLRVLARTPLLRRLPARIVGLGIWPVHARPS